MKPYGLPSGLFIYPQQVLTSSNQGSRLRPLSQEGGFLVEGLIFLLEVVIFI